MIAAISSRDSAVVQVVFAQGSYGWGLLDARMAGTARLVISANASGMDRDIVKPGSLVHIYPQRSHGHWYGLITADPVYQAARQVYEIQATEVTGFLGDIANVAQFIPPSGTPDPGEAGSGASWWR